MLRIIFLFFLSAHFFTGFSQNNDITIVINPTCGGANTGSIIVDIQYELDENIPQPPYSFTWTDIEEEPLNASNENTDNGHSELLGLSAGSYCLIVESLTDDCIAETCEILVEESPIQIQENPPTICICPNGGFGSISPIISGGTEPYTFAWTGEDGYVTNTLVADGIADVGFYTIVVTDINGCTATSAFLINECSPQSIYTSTLTHSCDGPGTGSIDVAFESVVQSPIAFFWTYNDTTYTGAINNPSGLQSTIQNLQAGHYCLTAFTGNGCNIYECWDIIESQGIEEVQVAVQASTGLIALYDSEGLLFGDDYVYEWTGPNGFQSDTWLFNATESGMYHVVISYPNPNDNPCTKELSVELFTCDDLETMSMIDPDSIGFPLSTEVFVSGDEKTIDLSINGLEDYYFAYEWSNGATTQDITIQESGEYCVTAIEKSCDIPFTICVDVCDFGLKLFETQMQPECGVSIQAYPYEPSVNFTYLWDDGSTSSYFTFDYNNEHCVTVTNNGCSMSACMLFPQAELTVSAVVTDNSFGASTSDGSIDLTVSGGKPPYSFVWNDPSLSGEDVTNLSGGDYVVTVTDYCDNIEILNIHVDCIIPLQTIIDCATITPVVCSNSLGSISIDESCINSALDLPSTMIPSV